MRAVLGLIVAVLLCSVTVVPAHAAPTPYPVPTGPVDYDKLAQQIAQQVNEARMHPDALADGIESLLPTYDGDSRLKLPDGSDVYVNVPTGSFADNPTTKKRYITQSVAEARIQAKAPLPALPWSALVASYARQWVPNSATWPHGTEPGSPPRPLPKGLDRNPIEGAGGADANPLTFVYQGWISDYDLWDLNSTFDPYQSWKVDKGNPLWRGHRGGINDRMVKSIGVACGPHTYPWEPKRASARCLIDAYYGDAPDVSPTATPADGQASLTNVKGSLTGTIGSAVNGGSGSGTATITVDTSSTPAPIATTDATIPAPPTTSNGSSSPASSAAAGESAAPTSSSSAGGPSSSRAPSSGPVVGVRLCKDDDYAGSCISPTADQPNLSKDGVLGNDVLSSMKVPKGTWVSVYRHFDYQGDCQAFGADQRTLKGTKMGQDQASSFKISTSEPTDCTQTGGLVLCQDDDYAGKCISPTADQPNMSKDDALGNDVLSSMKVPEGAWLSLYRDFDYGGDCQSFSGDQATLAKTRIGADQASSFKITDAAPKGCSADN